MRTQNNIKLINVNRKFLLTGSGMLNNKKIMMYKFNRLDKSKIIYNGVDLSATWAFSLTFYYEADGFLFNSKYLNISVASGSVKFNITNNTGNKYETNIDIDTSARNPHILQFMYNLNDIGIMVNKEIQYAKFYIDKITDFVIGDGFSGAIGNINVFYRNTPKTLMELKSKSNYKLSSIELQNMNKTNFKYPTYEPPPQPSMISNSSARSNTSMISNSNPEQEEEITQPPSQQLQPQQNNKNQNNTMGTISQAQQNTERLLSGIKSSIDNFNRKEDENKKVIANTAETIQALSAKVDLLKGMEGFEDYKTLNSFNTNENITIKPLNDEFIKVMVNDKCLTVYNDKEYILANCDSLKYSQNFRISQVVNDVDAQQKTGIYPSATDRIYPYNIVKSIIPPYNCLTIEDDGVSVQPCSSNRLEQQWNLSNDVFKCMDRRD